MYFRGLHGSLKHEWRIARHGESFSLKYGYRDGNVASFGNLQHLFTTDRTPKQREGFNQEKGKLKSV
jgi:hypothetical protein